MSDNIHDIKKFAAGLNRALQSVEENGELSHWMADYVESTVPKVLEYANRAHSCVDKAEQAISKIETEKLVKSSDIAYIEQVYPGFARRTDQNFTIDDSRTGLAGAVEAINWAKAGKVGIIAAILAAIAALVALFIKRRKEADGDLVEDLNDNVKNAKRQMKPPRGSLEDRREVYINILSKVLERVNERYKSSVNYSQIKKAFQAHQKMVIDNKTMDQHDLDQFTVDLLDFLIIPGILQGDLEGPLAEHVANLDMLRELYGVDSGPVKSFNVSKRDLETLAQSWRTTMTTFEEITTQNAEDMVDKLEKSKVFLTDENTDLMPSLKSLELIESATNLGSRASIAVNDTVQHQFLLSLFTRPQDVVDSSLLELHVGFVNTLEGQMSALDDKKRAEYDAKLDKISSELSADKPELAAKVKKLKSDYVIFLRRLSSYITVLQKYSSYGEKALISQKYILGFPKAIANMYDDIFSETAIDRQHGKG